LIKFVVLSGLLSVTVASCYFVRCERNLSAAQICNYHFFFILLQLIHTYQWCSREGKRRSCKYFWKRTPFAQTGIVSSFGYLK